jgi:hypothetical protein
MRLGSVGPGNSEQALDRRYHGAAGLSSGPMTAANRFQKYPFNSIGYKLNPGRIDEPFHQRRLISGETIDRAIDRNWAPPQAGAAGAPTPAANVGATGFFLLDRTAAAVYRNR